MFKQVFWDWNGTLLDDLRYGMDVRNRVFPGFGLPGIHDVDEYREQFTFPISEYYARAGVTDDIFPAVAHAWMDEYVRGFASVPLFADARDTLEAFRAAGIAQVILSATKADLLRDQVEPHGIAPYFETLLGLDNIYGASKVDIARAYMTRCGTAPSDCVFLGDTLHDAEVARAVGARCILIARGHHSRERLRTAGVPVVETLGDTIPLVLG